MRIAIEGCAHGELDIIYETLREIEKRDGKTIDLLICCGDFQATRNLTDLRCMAVSNKYRKMCTFYKYYSGEKVAPVLTIFIGGNHEASNHLQELSYGGWVAPNIYYLGYAGVVQVGGIRIAGLSGIYKSSHWMQGHYEMPPYNPSTIRSVYHVRNLEVFRLKQLSGKIDIFLSHDWPAGVTKYGDEDALLREKPFFKDDIQNNILGSPPCMELLKHFYPSYWFSAHLHCKFAALVPEKGGTRVTKFLALDKCLPKRKFLQILEIGPEVQSRLELSYDLEWLTILYLTNHLLSIRSSIQYMPGQHDDDRWSFTPTETERHTVRKNFTGDLRVPSNFTQTVKPYSQSNEHSEIEQPCLLINDQTTLFCETLGIDNPSTLLQHSAKNKLSILPMNSTGTSEFIDMSFEGSVLNSTYEDNSTSKYSVDDSPINASPKSDGDEYRDSDNVDTSKSVLDDSIDHSNTFADSVSTEDSNGQCIQTESDCKRFKRRNYSIYSSTV